MIAGNAAAPPTGVALARRLPYLETTVAQFGNSGK